MSENKRMQKIVDRERNLHLLKEEISAEIKSRFRDQELANEDYIEAEANLDLMKMLVCQHRMGQCQRDINGLLQQLRGIK